MFPVFANTNSTVTKSCVPSDSSLPLVRWVVVNGIFFSGILIKHCSSSVLSEASLL